VLIYIHLLRTLTPLNIDECDECENSTSSIDILKPPPILRVTKDLNSASRSRLQQSVITALSHALHQRHVDFELENEYSAFGGAFPVDCTVFDGDDNQHKHPIAFIEVDGPQHYKIDGALRRKDIMKELLYRKKYPGASFTRVRFDQVNRLGSASVACAVADFVTLASGHSGHNWVLENEDVACTVRRCERELKIKLSGGRCSTSTMDAMYSVFY
jgi:hypothetical protein